MAIKITEVTRDGKKVFEGRFQPTLEDGTNIGGEQVVYSDTRDGIADEVADSYTHLYRKNREFNLKEKVKAPAGTPVVQEVPKFNPRPLSAQERMDLSRSFNDPEKIDAALDIALAAKFGASPSTVAHSVETNSRSATEIQAAQQAEAWKDMHPEFIPTQENVLAIASWVRNRNLPYTIENFDKALLELNPALETAPASPLGTPEKPLVDTPTNRIVAPVVDKGQRQKSVPTTISRATGSSRGASKKEGMTAEQFRRLPNEDRRRYMKEHPNAEFSS
jgi:hypothetical protein